LARLVSLLLLCLCACNAEDEVWASPEHFEIGLTTSACFGTCPVYQMSVDERGSLHFYGKAWVEKPGAYDADVSATDVKKLYAEILQAGFLHMQDSYLTEADGCAIATDAPTSYFSLRADDKHKRVDYYWGCEIDEQEPVFEKLRGLKDRIESSMLERFLGSRALDYCLDKVRPPLPSGSYVLQGVDDGEQLGVLSIVEEARGLRWNAQSCQGDQLSTGNVFVGNCEVFLVPAEDATLKWPGLEPRQSAVRIGAGDEVGFEGWMALHTLELNDEHTQVARTGSACAD
jgi:hypothetical protein